MAARTNRFGLPAYEARTTEMSWGTFSYSIRRESRHKTVDTVVSDIWGVIVYLPPWMSGNFYEFLYLKAKELLETIDDCGLPRSGRILPEGMLKKLPKFSVRKFSGESSEPEERRGVKQTIELSGTIVPYLIKTNPRAKSARIVVGANGLEVRGWTGMPLATAERLMRKHEQWVLGHLSSYERIEKRYADGGRIPYRGGWAALRLGMSDSIVIPSPQDTEIWLSVPLDAESDTIKRELVEVLKREAWRVINDCWIRVAVSATKMPKSWTIGAAKRTWGVCKGNGQIRLTWRLIAFTDSEIEYIIAHELAHLVEFNHSRAFWCEVGKILPDWKPRDERIKARPNEETLTDL